MKTLTSAFTRTHARTQTRTQARRSIELLFAVRKNIAYYSNNSASVDLVAVLVREARLTASSQCWTKQILQFMRQKKEKVRTAA